MGVAPRDRLEQETLVTLKELFHDLDQQVRINVASASQFEESSHLIGKTLSYLGSFDEFVSNSTKIFRKLSRSKRLYKSLFYLSLIVYLATCSIILFKRLTPGFIYRWIVAISGSFFSTDSLDDL